MRIINPMEIGKPITGTSTASAAPDEATHPLSTDIGDKHGRRAETKALRSDPENGQHLALHQLTRHLDEICDGTPSLDRPVVGEHHKGPTTPQHPPDLTDPG